MVTCAAVLGMAACSLAARPENQYALDPPQSSVHFALTGSHEVSGTFHITSGEIVFDRASGRMSGKIIVSAASGESGNDSRDKKMKKDQLIVSEFPDVTFEPTSF